MMWVVEMEEGMFGNGHTRCVVIIINNRSRSGDFNKYTAQSYTIRNGVEIFGGRRITHFYVDC